MVAAASSHEHSGASSAAATPAWALSLGSGTPITPVEETNTSLGSQLEVARDLRHDRLDRIAPAIAGEGVGIAGVDHQRPGLAEADLLTAQFDLARTAYVLGEHSGDRGPFCEFDIGQVAAAPVLVPGTRDVRRDAGNLRDGREGLGEWGAFEVHDPCELTNGPRGQEGSRRRRRGLTALVTWDQHEGGEIKQASDDQQVVVAGEQRGIFEASADDRAEQVDGERRLAVARMRKRLAKATLARKIGMKAMSVAATRRGQNGNGSSISGLTTHARASAEAIPV